MSKDINLNNLDDVNLCEEAMQCALLIPPYSKLDH